MAWADGDKLDFLKDVLSASLYDESAWRMVSGPLKSQYSPSSQPLAYLGGTLKTWIVRQLRKRGMALVRLYPFNVELRHKGIDWPLFGYTMVGRQRLDNVQFCVETLLREEVAGDLIETGVWRGGSVILMKAVLAQHGDESRQIWCADSFEGLPPPNATDRAIEPNSDFSGMDYLAVSQEQVEANFTRFGLLDDRVRFLKGWFSDTLPTAPVEKLALLRMDGDLYESSMDALTHLYPKMVSGGFVIVDDYGTWAGCRKAVDEYRAEHGITAEMMQIDNAGHYWRVP